MSGDGKTNTAVVTDTKVDYDDIDDIIAQAERIKQAEADKLSVDDVKEVALELGIAPEHVERAIDELQARREREATAKKQAVAEARQQQKKLLMVGGGVATALVVAVAIFAGVALAGEASLRQQWSLVEQKRAQLENVVERQQAVEELWHEQIKADPSLKTSTDRRAELAGAENRVRIERKRYDEAAAEYNSAVSSTTGRLWSSMFDLPEEAPSAGELTGGSP